MKLDIGSGDVRFSGWTSVDRYGSPDILADAWQVPLPPGSVSEIRSSHALEHLSFEDAPKALAEWLRLLESGGRLHLVVPSMDFVAAVWLHGGDRDYARQIVFGNQQHEGEFHRNGWRPQDLKADVEAAGFVEVTAEVRFTPEYSQESIVVRAFRP